MQLSLGEVFVITLVSMGIVFLILLGLMYLMMATSAIVNKLQGKEKPSVQAVTVAMKEDNLTYKELFERDPKARVASLIALIEANKEKAAHYTIVQIEKQVGESHENI